MFLSADSGAMPQVPKHRIYLSLHNQQMSKADLLRVKYFGALCQMLGDSIERGTPAEQPNVTVKTLYKC